MNLHDCMLPVTEDCIFREDGYYVWCGSVFRFGGVWYMAYSRWESRFGFEGWVTDSEICLAKSDFLLGRFSYVRTIRGKSGAGRWDADCAHNPVILLSGGRCYLYYMGNWGNGEYWNHQGHQSIGAAWADDPMGEWHFSDEPLLRPSPAHFDCDGVSNPTVISLPDGTFYMMYKGWEKGVLCTCSTARAKHPLGPFVHSGVPLYINPDHPMAVEDPCVYLEDGKFHVILKDFEGYFTGSGHASTAHFVSDDGEVWIPDAQPFVSDLSYRMADGTVRHAARLERPQMIFDEQGRKAAILFACRDSDPRALTYNIRIPLAQT